MRHKAMVKAKRNEEICGLEMQEGEDGGRRGNSTLEGLDSRDKENLLESS